MVSSHRKSGKCGLRFCYTLQLVLQQIYLKNWSFMIRGVTWCNISCNLSRHFSRSWDLFCNRESLLAARLKYCETNCKRDVTLCNG